MSALTVRVLLVDDEEDARASLAERLRRFRGVELVGVVGDQLEAAGALTRSEPDVLLVDLHSRHWEGDGAQLCCELRKMASAPVVVLASFMTRERWQRLRAAGVANCLLKQVDSERLERELVLAAKRYRSDADAVSEREHVS